MSDLRIQPLPPETLAAQRPVVDPSRAAGVTAAATPAVAASSQGNASGGGGAAGAETPRDQYISPFITIDPTSGLVITQYRNSETGQLQKQYPSEKAVREYRNLQPAAVSASGERGAAPATGAARPAAPATTADGPAPGRAAAPVPAVQSPAPVQVATPSPAPQPAAPAPSGGLDKGSA